MAGHGRTIMLTVVAFAAFAAHAAERATAGPMASEVVSAQEEHTERLMSMDGVVGTAAGSEAVLVLCEDRDAAGRVPDELDGVPVETRSTGRFAVLDSRSTGQRRGQPVPIGVSTSAAGRNRGGTVACRVTDGAQVYGLSTWHTWAQGRSKGSEVVQPAGASDSSDSVLGTLSDFTGVSFAAGTENYAEAAVALTSTKRLGVATPQEGYGLPSSRIVQPSAGMEVQKYGAGTGLTTGKIIGTNGVLDVTYASGTARFVDQVIIGRGGTFAGFGDSGALVVTRRGASPVGLLFAGGESGKVAAAHPIGVVLARFGVSIDNRELIDLAVTKLDAARAGDQVDVKATLKNLGGRDVTKDIQVRLKQKGDGVVATGVLSGGLELRESETVLFTWEPSSRTDATVTLVAVSKISDDKPENDSASTTLSSDEMP